LTKHLFRCGKCGKESRGKRSATKHAKRHRKSNPREFVEDWMEDLRIAPKKRRGL
jgi:hypothetical protein